MQADRSRRLALSLNRYRVGLGTSSEIQLQHSRTGDFEKGVVVSRNLDCDVVIARILYLSLLLALGGHQGYKQYMTVRSRAAPNVIDQFETQYKDVG